MRTATCAPFTGETANSGEHQTAQCQARVLYADTDGMGMVYHATYLRWFETGRAHYMRIRNMPYSQVEKSGLSLPVVEAHAEYLKPARYDDLLEIKTKVADVGRAQVRFEYVICCGGKELVRGYTRHAVVNPNGRPTRLPETLREALHGPPGAD